ncbi:MAG: DUF2695 domain-containing protein [Frankiaceae bacterium]|nr:DUF2695 domain-containing protein [Frankiaceae bacterium]
MDDADAAVIAAAEQHVKECLSAALLPRPTDCLACYLHRAVDRWGCDGKLTLTHEWQGHQRRMRRRTGGLTAYLKSRGGYCDCEVLMNVYPDREPDDNPQSARCPHPYQ